MVIQRAKPTRVLVGVSLMAASVVVPLLILAQFLGSWGVPFFSFSTERGSPCRNALAGYTCTPITLGDLEFFGDVDLPDGTRVISGSYESTHDYRLDALVEVPAGQSDEAWQHLRLAFGKCQRNHPAALDPTGLTSICIFANDEANGDVVEGAGASSRLFTVGTGVRRDGVRVISFQIRSR